MTTLDDIHNTWDHQLPPAVDDDEYTARYGILRVAWHPAIAAILAAHRSYGRPIHTRRSSTGDPQAVRGEVA